MQQLRLVRRCYQFRYFRLQYQNTVNDSVRTERTDILFSEPSGDCYFFGDFELCPSQSYAHRSSLDELVEALSEVIGDLKKTPKDALCNFCVITRKGCARFANQIIHCSALIRSFSSYPRQSLVLGGHGEPRGSALWNPVQ